MLRKIATAAVALGYTLDAECEGEIDYSGNSVSTFMEAMNACDEMRAVFYNGSICIGWCYYSVALDADEQIIDHDCGGFVDTFLNGED